MKKTIEIEGTKYPIRFGYGAFRILGEKWNCSGVQAVANRFQELFPEKGSDDVSFEQGNTLGDLALAGMENAGVEDAPSRDDVVNEMMFVDSEQIQVLMNAFAESFPKSGNPKPRKKTGKKK